MASLHRDSRNSPYIASFRDSKGKQHRQSTHETDPKRAQKVADQLETAAKGIGNPVKVRQAFQTFFREHFQQDLPDAVTVREFFTQWMNARKPELALNSVRCYQSAITRFLAFLEEKADRPIDEITTKDILAYRDHLVARISAGNVNAVLSVLHLVFRSARIDGQVITDPAEAVKSVRRECASYVRRPFTLDEVRAVLAVADDEWRSMIKFAFYTGQRLIDIALLTWNQIDLQTDELRLSAQKTRKTIMIPLVGPLKEHVISLPAGDNPRSPVHPRAHRIVAANGRTSWLSIQFGDLLISAGLRQVRLHEKKDNPSLRRASYDLSFHSLRHTAVSRLKEAGASPAVAMEYIGHDSAMISAHYTHVGKEALVKAAASMPQI